MPFTVYLITNRVNGKLYVGQTTRSLEDRRKEHLRGKVALIDRKIRQYGATNFDLSVLLEVRNQTDLDATERFFIKLHGAHVSRSGYNIDWGGYGGKKSDEHLAALKEAQKRPEVRARKSEAGRANWASPISRARRSSEVRIAWADPVRAEKQSAAMRLAAKRPEVKEKKSATMRRSWADPEARKARMAAIAEARGIPGARAKEIKAKTAAWADPQKRETRLAKLRATIAQRRVSHRRHEDTSDAK